MDFSLSFLITFGLTFTLSDIKIVTAACCLVPVAWNTLSFLYIKVLSVFDGEVGFLDATEKSILFSNPVCYSVSFYWGN